MKLTLENIDRTINNLDRLMPAKLNKNSTHQYSLKEGIFLLACKLMEKREMGCTTNELVKALADDGIVIKAATLNHYLCEYQNRHQSKPDTPPDEGGDHSGVGTGNEKTGPLLPPASQEKPPPPQHARISPINRQARENPRPARKGERLKKKKGQR